MFRRKKKKQLEAALLAGLEADTQEAQQAKATREAQIAQQAQAARAAQQVEAAAQAQQAQQAKAAQEAQAAQQAQAQAAREARAAEEARVAEEARAERETQEEHEQQTLETQDAEEAEKNDEDETESVATTVEETSVASAQDTRESQKQEIPERETKTTFSETPPQSVDTAQDTSPEQPPSIQHHTPQHSTEPDPVRLGISKTYKIFVGGAFPRSESGRTYPVYDSKGTLLAHAVRSSRKDVRDAVKAARAAQADWASRTAYNRGQVLYRIAEMMEARRQEFITELQHSPYADNLYANQPNFRNADLQNLNSRNPNSKDPGVDHITAEIDTAIDRWIWYAGWCDKFAAVSGSSNPVSGPYFSFTIPEPMGVVGLIAPEESPLVGLVSRLAPSLVAGNTAVVLASNTAPLPAVTLGEAMATADVPAGVVNILTGHQQELVPPLASHGDVNILDLTGCDTVDGLFAVARAEAAATVTRIIAASPAEQLWLEPSAESPYIIEAFCEHKAVWHPKGA